jgi:hypothetical protein
VLVSVVVITTTQAKKVVATAPQENTADVVEA